MNLNGDPVNGYQQQKDKKNHDMFRWTHLVMFSVIFYVISGVFCAGGSFAGQEILERDINNDGTIDQVVYFDDKDQVSRLETDSDADGVVDTIQYYENGDLVRSERDTDGDCVMNVRNHFVQGRRILQEKMDQTGNVIYMIMFDKNDKISEIKEDHNHDGDFERGFFYIDGILASSVADETGDGNINVWKTYENKQVVYRKDDENGDGLPEQEIFYNQKQTPEKSRHDLDNDGYLETLREYAQGKMINEKKDLNKDNVFDVTITYIDQDETVKTQDLNFDGHDDIETFYKNGKRVSYKKDTDSDGVMDRTVFFDSSGNPEKIVMDTNANGVPDQWQGYYQESLEWFEKDRNHDGKADLKIFYLYGEKQRLISDDDFNGFFEITQWFDRKDWTVVVEIDSDANNSVDARLFYTVEGLARKDVDENSDGRIDFREYYDPSGRLIKSEEAVDGAECLNIAWYYDESEIPIRAEKDQDSDGRPDIWYYYVDERMANVREDTNHDGRPDIWEEYDVSGSMVGRSKDLNFDGVPDIKEDIKEAIKEDITDEDNVFDSEINESVKLNKN